MNTAMQTLIDGKFVSASFIVSSLVFILIALHFYYKNRHSFWHKRGVKGPKPWPVVGNLVQLFWGNRMLQERDWVRKYGKVYGVYFASSPRLVIADPDVLRQVCIKDFDVFPNHDPSPFVSKFQRHFIVFEQDEHWKRVRSMLAPTFTSLKIRRMFKLLEVCADDLVECFREQLAEGSGEQPSEAVVDVRNTFALYTMDAIASCCYGLKLERAGSSNLKGAAARNQFVAIGMKVFETSWPKILAAFVVPKRVLELVNYEFQPAGSMEPFAEFVEKMIKLRRKSARKLDDYLQLLLDVKFNDELALDKMDRHENHHAGLTEQSIVEAQHKLISDVQSMQTGDAAAGSNSGSTPVVPSNINKMQLSDLEILGNAILLLIVGMETTTTVLTHCIYSLAFHEECQAKLYGELSKIDVSKSSTRQETSDYAFDYETLTSCVYLDAVVSETLRYLTPGIHMDRVGNRDYKIEKYNLTIPKGTILNLAFYAIMNDPDYWPEPDKFDPERFMPGRREKIHPGSYCPFGLGPRHCLAMRFGLAEIKVAIAKLVMQFKFKPAPGATFPPEPKVSLIMNKIKNSNVRVVGRE